MIYPVHLNPHVLLPARKLLGGVDRIHLLRPLTYEETYWIMTNCFAILTDSGGIQEEAPSLCKPVLVLRNVTERTEGIHAGIAKLVGTHSGRIVKETGRLLSSKQVYQRMIGKANPYGDGFAAKRIIACLQRILR